MSTLARSVLHHGLAVLFAITAPILVIDAGQAQDVAIKILVNDDPISDYDIAQRERFLMITAKAQPGPELKKQSTDMLIDERLQLQEGRKLGITPDEEQVNGVLLDMASKNNLDVNGLSTALARAGVNIRTLKNRIGAQMVWQRVVQQKFRREVQVNDADIDRELSGSRRWGGLRAAFNKFALSCQAAPINGPWPPRSQPLKTCAHGSEDAAASRAWPRVSRARRLGHCRRSKPRP